MIIRKIENQTAFYYEGNQCVFSMQEQNNNSNVEILLSGSLRSEFSRDFEDELRVFALLGLPVYVDCEKLTYLSKSGMEVLLTVQHEIDRREKGSLIVRKVPSDIYQECVNLALVEYLQFQQS